MNLYDVEMLRDVENVFSWICLFSLLFVYFDKVMWYFYGKMNVSEQKICSNRSPSSFIFY